LALLLQLIRSVFLNVPKTYGDNMATTTIHPSLNVIYRPQLAPERNPALHPLLELSLVQTNSQGAYVYALDRAGHDLQLVAATGRPASDIETFDVQLRPASAQWHRENQTAVVLARDAWSDWRFEGFPEFLRNRFPAAASIQLIEAGEVVGVANVCRVLPAAYNNGEVAFLRSLSLPLGALISHSAARQKLESEVEELSRKLADRKLLERAKGLLQARHQWTEEEAYLHLRRLSRQRRTPMRLIAREVIQPASSA
jgi:signal transduction protein with GAF and PtsI domain